MKAKRTSIRLRVLLVLLGAVGWFSLVGWPKVRQALAARFVVRAEVPSVDALQTAFDGASDPDDFLERVWQTGRVPQRAWVMSRLGQAVATGTGLKPRQEAILRAGARDADLNVREQALSLLAAEHSSALLPLAAVQLVDVDPEIRLLGLRLIRQCDARQALPLVVPLLEDKDLRVVASAETALRGWTGIDYGVRMFHVLAADGGRSAADPARLATIRHAVAQRQTWWREHQAEFMPTNAATWLGKAPTPVAPPVSDFALPDLSGQSVWLSQYRGHPVLLNFWATWCTACAAELPDLLQLAHNPPNGLVILGISLDGVPDEHGHVAEAGDHAGEAGSGAGSTTVVTLRERVKRFAQARGITYPVLLDPHNAIGSRFHGGELPTNVLLDGEGRLRRRFIGGRSAAVFQAMVEELQPDYRSGADTAPSVRKE